MRNELIMEAIGNISDKHIMEFANADSIRKRHLTHVFSMVASICIIVTLSGITGLFWKEILPSTHGGGDIIWGDGDIHSYEDSTNEKVKLGVVEVSDALEKAFSGSDSESDVFAMEVREMSGMEKVDVYQHFVLKLGVEEDYLERGIIFATKKQVASFECPANMAIVLYPADIEEKDTVINRENINNLESEMVLVTVNLKDDIENLLQEIGEYENILSPDEYQAKRLSAIQENVDATIHAVLDDYNIPNEILLAKGKYLPYFRAELSKETLEKLLEDNRVGTIIMHDSSAGVSDFERSN